MIVSALIATLALASTEISPSYAQEPAPRWVWCVASERDYGQKHSVSHVFAVPYHTNELAIERDFDVYVDSEWAPPMGLSNCTASLDRADAEQLRVEFIRARRADNHYVSEEGPEDWIWDGD